MIRAEQTCPSITWIGDSLSDFLDRADIRAQLDGSFDLIIDRGYPSLIANSEQATREARGVAALLKREGTLIHVVSRSSYADWAHLTCAGWDRSLFEIRAAVSGPGIRIDDDNCYVTVYAEERGPTCPAATEPLPGETDIRDIEFELPDGERMTWYLVGNEGMQIRAWHHGVRNGLLEPYRFRMPSEQRTRDLESSLSERARNTWRSGRPAVLDPGGAILGERGRRIRYQQDLYDRLDQAGFNILHYPRSCGDLRAYHAALNEWVAALPDVVVLGPGLTDCRHDPSRGGEVVTDLDQFRYVLGWVIERLQDEAGATVAWIEIEPPPREILAGGNIRADDLAAFAAVARDVARRRGVKVHRVPYELVAPDGTPIAPQAAEQVAGVVREIVSAAVT